MDESGKRTAGISLLYDVANGYHREFWSLLQPLLIAVNLVLETATLCWVGMWKSIVRRLFLEIAWCINSAGLAACP